MNVALHCLFAAGIAFAFTVPVTAAPIYHLTYLGTLGGAESQANGINDSGQVVGESTNAAENYHAFLWTASGGMQDLGTLPGNSVSDALAINASGDVVGQSGPGSSRKAALWVPGNGVQSLGTLPGHSTSVAVGVNGSGNVVGQSGTSSEFVWSNASGLQNFGSGGLLEAINDSGQIAGTNSLLHAALWSSTGVMQDLGSLHGAFSRALGINAAGDVVGSSNDAFLWTPSGGMQDIGTLFPGSTSSFALSINSANDIVGYANYSNGTTIPALWTADGNAYNLNTCLDTTYPGWVLQDCSGINSSGDIVGQGQLNGHLAAFLLTPVPEPSSLALTVLAIAGLTLAARFRRCSPRGAFPSRLVG